MLYLVSTPIGNLNDISLRAIETLEKIRILLCEDTRVAQKLLSGLGIKNRPELVSFYDEVEEQKIPKVVEWLTSGAEVGLISDAGTPLLSDPGWKLVRKCRSLGIRYTAIPGANAITNALVLSGLPIGRFCFIGFLPKRSGERLRILEKYKNIDGAKVVFESPRRVNRLISEIKIVGGRDWRIIREMTKKFEDVTTEMKDERGEAVVVFI